MVSCGKRGSLPVAGWANMVAANQPPAAATVSDESRTDVECIIASVIPNYRSQLNPARSRGSSRFGTK